MSALPIILPLLVLLGAPPVHAQLPDSAGTVRSARAAQARFERIRRQNLPWTWDRGGGDCDERIGRFCLTHGDGDDSDWRSPPEPEKVQQARRDLIAQLDSAATHFPGDGWIAGQRVRYQAEAGGHPQAVQAAEQCRAIRWWCLALAGYAQHVGGDYVAADSAFALALAAMPAKERREWTDVSVLLEEGWRGYRRAEGAERDSLEQRFWWMSDPLWIVPGNERRTEHFARHVMDQLQDRSRSTEGISWGFDLRELLLRYGWPVGWERERSSTPAAGPASIISHYAPRARKFVPPLRFLEDPTAIRPDEWTVKVRRARTEFALPYARWSDAMQHQLAAFRRGDSTVWVAAYTVAADTAVRGPLDAALVVVPHERAQPAMARISADTAGALSISTAPGPAVLSLELLTRGDSARATRARYGVRAAAGLTSGIALSDILLLKPVDPLPRSLPEVIPVARGSTRVTSGERVGLYWEVYGVPTGTETINVSVSLNRDGRNWLRRETSPVQLSWQERPGEGPILGRSLLVTLPNLSPGRYTLQVRVAPEGGPAATTSRVVEVGREPTSRTSLRQTPQL